MKYTNEPAFVNREPELQYLQKWLTERPKNILFIYGPKSSGKTTLLYHLTDHLLNHQQFDIKYLNLRKVLIVNYSDFLQTMFGIDYGKSQKKEIKKKQEYSLKIFKLTLETLGAIENKELDPFEVMERELLMLNRKGKKPVIIVDELQALEGIYMNSQRELIKELFNFFVAMTKESHLAHVIIASSDGYFIEKIYDDSKLRKASDFLLVDYLDKEDLVYWLSNLEKESAISQYALTASQIETVWEKFGGSPFEISRLLGDLIMVAENGKLNDSVFEKTIQKKMIAARSLYMEYAGLYKHKMSLFQGINGVLGEKHHFKEYELLNLITEKYYDEAGLRNELNNLVRQNFLAYDPTTAEYSLQGRSMEIGLEMFVESVF